MMEPVESRMTALHFTLHPTEAASDLQADMAELRVHPVSVQSVPIEEFGLSQKLRLTLQLAGVMTASVVVSRDSSAAASSDDADASVFTSAETPLIAFPQAEVAALGQSPRAPPAPGRRPGRRAPSGWWWRADPAVATERRRDRGHEDGLVTAVAFRRVL